MAGLTAKQAAKELGISKSRVSQLIKLGVLKLNEENKITAESVVERKASNPKAGRPEGTFKER